MAGAAPTPVASEVADLVRRHGPVPFSQLVDLALYDPDHGFYARGGAAGRRGDFITSPEVGPLFGAVVARALDSWWDDLGRPDPYVVVEAGAGAGTLALSVLASRPRCAPALRYLLVERSAALRERQAEHLALAEPSTALGVAGGGDGPVVAALAELPSVPFVGVVLANELLDNLAFDLAVRDAGGWEEVRVGLDDAGALRRHAVVAPDELVRTLSQLVPDAPVGTVVPVQRHAAAWVAEAVELVERGRVVIVDYAVAATSELLDREPESWLRTFKGHERMGDPLVGLGEADITVDVCLDQIERLVRPVTSLSTQAEWLTAHGIDELVEEGRRAWAAGAAVGDLAALRARSRVREAEALLDPVGLGAFLVAEWARP